MEAYKVISILLAIAGTAASLKCYVNNADNDGNSCKPEFSCYEDCKEDESGSIYQRACKKITRADSVVNRGCGWQRSSLLNVKPDIISEMLNSQNNDYVDVDECSETSECEECSGEDGKNFNDLCSNAIQKKFPSESQATCLNKLREEKVHSVCFCSTDFCNSANYLKTSLFLIFSMLMKQLLI